MLSTDVLAFVRSALPAAPARVLEVGAGDGALAEALRAGGWDVVAIDPDPSGDGVQPVALLDLEAPTASFDAAVAVVSLHHVEPLAESCARLAEAVRPGGRLVVDEIDVLRLDERAVGWWLGQRAALGEPEDQDAPTIVGKMRGHLHPLGAIRDALAPWFELADPVPGPYLHRWWLPHALAPAEVELVAAGALPAVGARLVGTRRQP